MKQKRYIYGIVGCLLISMMLGISSCDGLEDELFQKNSYIAVSYTHLTLPTIA